MRFILNSITLALAAMISIMPAHARPALYTWEAVTESSAPSQPFTMEGKVQRTLADFKGQVVLLNLWATWCTPCLKELPTLDALEEQYAGKGLVVIPLSLDSNLQYDGLEEYIRKLGLELPHLAHDQDSSFARAFSAEGVPVTYLIDRSGAMRYRYAGATNWLKEENTAKIESLLGEAESR